LKIEGFHLSEGGWQKRKLENFMTTVPEAVATRYDKVNAN
jgi:hypothetical protein